MLKSADLQEFLLQNPLIKRILIVEKEKDTKYIVWTSAPDKLVIHSWKQNFEEPLRIVPKEPLEGGYTQELWNKVWDNAESLGPRIRVAQTTP